VEQCQTLISVILRRWTGGGGELNGYGPQAIADKKAAEDAVVAVQKVALPAALAAAHNTTPEGWQAKVAKVAKDAEGEGVRIALCCARSSSVARAIYYITTAGCTSDGCSSTTIPFRQEFLVLAVVSLTSCL
jgi:hypothetical protein